MEDADSLARPRLLSHPSGTVSAMSKKDLLVVATSRDQLTKKITRWCFLSGGSLSIEECAERYHNGTAEFAVKDRYGNVKMIHFGGGGSASGEPNPIQELLEALPPCKSC